MPTPRPGERWKEAREAAGLSVAQAAALAKIHRNTVYDLEKDDDGVTLRIMNKVAAVYGVTLADIFRGATRAEYVPAEFRPLLEPLLPLSQPQRVALIQNVASNLQFMAMMYAAGPEPLPRPEDRVPVDRPDEGERGIIPPMSAAG